jgi:hypothetical protein
MLLALLRNDTRTTALFALEADEAGWMSVLAEAKGQRVAGLAYRRLHEHGVLARVPPRVRQEFDEAARRVTYRVMRFHRELASLLDKLAATGVPVIPLKGACLATRYYRDLALRDFGDLDLLVPLDRLDDAVAAAHELGYRSSRQIDGAVVEATARHAPTCFKDGAGPIELHWQLAMPAEGVTIDVTGVWARSMPVTVLGRHARMLCPEDLVLHLCVHTSYQHLFGFGVRSLYDIAVVLDDPSTPFDWERFESLTRASRGADGAFLALDLARRLVGARVPAEALARLRPDTVDSIVLKSAEQQLFGDPALLRTLSSEVSRVVVSQRWARRWRHVRPRLFLRRVELAGLFGRDPAMTRVEQLFWHLVRLGDLVRRQGRTVVQLLGRRGSPLGETARRQELLRTWLGR